MKLRPATLTDLAHLATARELLANARTHARQAGAKRTRAYIAAAIKSTEGAQRHARRAYFVQTGITFNP